MGHCPSWLRADMRRSRFRFGHRPDLDLLRDLRPPSTPLWSHLKNEQRQGVTEAPFPGTSRSDVRRELPGASHVFLFVCLFLPDMGQIHSFSPQIFTEHLLCARRLGNTTGSATDPPKNPTETYFRMNNKINSKWFKCSSILNRW